MQENLEQMKWIYQCNQSPMKPERYSEFYQIERAWINQALTRASEQTSDLGKPVTGASEFEGGLRIMIESEKNSPAESQIYLAEHATFDEFKVLVEEFAVDGLTEAKAFFHMMPRLKLEAQMPLLRVMTDEFGGGNPKRAHTSLYRKLLRELDMSEDVDDYLDRISTESYGFVNLFYWLGLRAQQVELFAGALTYLESSIPSFFSHYVSACSRLGIQESTYYSEHIHIDHYHAQEGHRLLRAIEHTDGCDWQSAWKGVHLAALLVGDAFEFAVSRARRGERAVTLTRKKKINSEHHV